MIQPLIHIDIAGKSCTVPKGLNAVQAMWYSGFDLRRGIGCLGGVCGACTITYKSGEGPVKTALGCQTPVFDGMSFVLFGADVQKSVPYKTPLDPEKEMNAQALKTHFFETLPATKRCVSCGACTAVCPQEIDVMKGVKESLNGNYEGVSTLFLNCVMCGVCAAVCEVKVLPHLAGLYARKVTSLYLTHRTDQLQERVQEIRSGRYDAEWRRLLSLQESDFKKECLV